MYQTSVFHLSGIYEQEGFHRNRESLHFIDLTSLSGTNGYCDEAAYRALISHCNDGSFLHFLDNGNYHYLSKPLTNSIHQPFTLLLLDHHTDLTPSAFGDILSCGSWVRALLQDHPYAVRVIVAGPPKEAIAATLQANDPVIATALSTNRLELISEDCTHTDVLLPKLLQPVNTTVLPVYLSFDKDLLSPKEVLTNWDQGSLTADTLFQLFDAVFAQLSVLGFDIAGDAALDMPPALLPEAIQHNDRFNERILQFVEDHLSKGQP